MHLNARVLESQEGHGGICTAHTHKARFLVAAESIYDLNSYQYPSLSDSRIQSVPVYILGCHALAYSAAAPSLARLLPKAGCSRGSISSVITHNATKCLFGAYYGPPLVVAVF